MFDDVPNNVFWPLFAICWFLFGLFVSLIIGKVISWCDTPENRYDDVAERKRRLDRNGFKSRTGIK